MFGSRNVASMSGIYGNHLKERCMGFKVRCNSFIIGFKINKLLENYVH